MDVYSNSPEAVVRNLRIRHLKTLVVAIRDATLRQKDFIRTLYQQHSTHFDDTLLFLQEIGWVKVTDEQLYISPSLEFSIDPVLWNADFVRILFTAIISGKNKYHHLLARYLIQYDLVDSELKRKSANTDHLEISEVRNFLMDAQIVEFRHADDLYILRREYADLYLWARNLIYNKTKIAAADASAKRDLLGLNAELEIVRYEGIRLGTKYIPRIEHTSAANPFACYDIKSWTVNDTEVVQRFIEVKAVSRDSYEFFWTAAEIQASCLLGADYYLYLLPVISNTKFDIEKLVIVKNAYQVVYDNPLAWGKQENVVVCRPLDPHSLISLHNLQ